MNKNREFLFFIPPIEIENNEKNIIFMWQWQHMIDNAIIPPNQISIGVRECIMDNDMQIEN